MKLPHTSILNPEVLKNMMIKEKSYIKCNQKKARSIRGVVAAVVAMMLRFD